MTLIAVALAVLFFSLWLYERGRRRLVRMRLAQAVANHADYAKK